MRSEEELDVAINRDTRQNVLRMSMSMGVGSQRRYRMRRLALSVCVILIASALGHVAFGTPLLARRTCGFHLRCLRTRTVVCRPAGSCSSSDSCARPDVRQPHGTRHAVGSGQNAEVPRRMEEGMRLGEFELRTQFPGIYSQPNVTVETSEMSYSQE